MKQKKFLRSLILVICAIGICINLWQEYNPLNEQAGWSDEREVDSSKMNVHFLDVGQADCILIESEDQYMLVDAGNNEDEELVLSYLNDLGIKRLEYVIGTHPHEDHIGSLDAVIRNFEIGKVILPEKEHTTKTFENVLDAIEEKNLKITKPRIGETYVLGGASFTIVAPNDDYKDELNNWSVGIKLTHKDTSFVMCGDAEKEAEEDILANGIDIQGDVLKLGHHGSSTSSIKEFIDAVDPSYLVITCESGNSYGHPHKETMQWIKEREIPFFRTDEQGTIIASSDGEEITWNVEPSTSYKNGNN